MPQDAETFRLPGTGSALLPSRIASGFYPERQDRRPSALSRFLSTLQHKTTSPLRLRPAGFASIVPVVEGYREEFIGMSPDALAAATSDCRSLLRRHGLVRDSVARTFALVREASRRALSMPHYDVQLIGGWIMLQGMVAEMETGEGKTLSATLPACTAALAGIPVHIVTVNDYLARRDAEWMGPLYEELGLSVGIIAQGMSPEMRRAAYGCDITYCTNKELVFDYLKDRLLLGRAPNEMQMRLDRLQNDGQAERLCLRGLPFAIVDEADSVLIDEARTPLIISGAGSNAFEARIYQQASELAAELEEERDFSIDRAKRAVELTETGDGRLAELSSGQGAFWTGRHRRREIIRQALHAWHLFEKDRDYLIRDGKIEIIDEFTGRTMADRSWERGLHQLIEAKEGLEVTSQRDTLARISYQRFFRRYRLLAGMTGTAREVADELWSVYRLPVVRVPPNRPVCRTNLPSRLFADSESKWRAVLERIREIHQSGRPLLIGTRSVATSEHLSELLRGEGLEHRVLNARQDEEEAEVIAAAGQQGRITVATNMAGRGTDIHLGPGVRHLGGLHVLATERHTARRIDRQLFGRCGRQGDPGSCELLAALDDEIFKAHLGPAGRGLLQKILLSRLPGTAWLADRLATLVQVLVERREFHARHDLLQFDESLEDVLAFSGSGE